MGACSHIAGVFCDNCDPLRSRMIGDGGVGTYRPINIGAPFDIPQAPALATADEVAALRAEVEKLKKRLESLDDRYLRARRLMVCPVCKGRTLMLPEDADQPRLSCKGCFTNSPRKWWGEE